MPEEPTSTPAGQTPEGQTPAAPETATPEGTPPSRMFTEAEVAAARKKAEADKREAEKRATDLEAQFNELKQSIEAEKQKAEDANKSEIQKALERAQAAEAREADALNRAAVSQRQALIATVAAESAPGIPTPFLKLVEGDDEDTIRESLQALEALGKSRWAPKSIGAPGNPPPAPGEATGGNGEQRQPMNADRLAQLDELNKAASDTRHPNHHNAIAELAKLTGMRAR